MRDRRWRKWVITALLVLLVQATAEGQEAETTEAPAVDDPPAENVPAVPPPPPADEAAADPEPTVTGTEAPPAARPAMPGVLSLGELTLRPSLQFRARYEGRVNAYRLGGPAPDAHFVGERVRVGADARWRNLRVFTQIQDVRTLGTIPGVDDGGKLALHQGFFEVGSTDAWLRLGRQEIVYGDERLLGSLDWQMAARSFDALRMHVRRGKLELDAFGAMLAPVSTFTLPVDGMPTTYATRGDYLAGVQATVTPSPAFTMDVYVLHRHDGPTEAAPTRQRDIATPGVRAVTVLAERLRLSAEGMLQLGRANGDRHFAYAVAGDARYTASAPRSTTQLGLGGALGSGARNTGERVDGFENLFPTNHKFYGFADLFNLQNLVDVHASVSVRAKDVPFSMQAAFFYFAQQQASAPWTAAGGASLGLSQTDGRRSLGGELDVVATYEPIPRLVLGLGDSVFVPGPAAERLGHDRAQHWFFAMVGVDTP